MKKGILRISLIAALILVSAYSIIAQSKASPWKGITFLADKQTKSGNISVQQFIELIKQPLQIQDNRDHQFYTPTRFSMSYAERGMYEDEKGKPMIITDYLSGHGTDKVDSATLNDLINRAKPGDTAFIEGIYFINTKLKDKTSVQSEPLKLILTK